MTGLESLLDERTGYLHAKGRAKVQRAVMKAQKDPSAAQSILVAKASRAASEWSKEEALQQVSNRTLSFEKHQNEIFEVIRTRLGIENSNRLARRDSAISRIETDIIEKKVRSGHLIENDGGANDIEPLVSTPRSQNTHFGDTVNNNPQSSKRRSISFNRVISADDPAFTTEHVNYDSDKPENKSPCVPCELEIILEFWITT